MSKDLQRDIDLFWDYVENAWDIEPRAYFERAARSNGFESPLAMAAHHMWKRETKARPGASDLTAQIKALRDAEPYVNGNERVVFLKDVLTLVEGSGAPQPKPLRCPVWHVSGKQCQRAEGHKGECRHEETFVTTWMPDRHEQERLKLQKKR